MLRKRCKRVQNVYSLTIYCPVFYAKYIVCKIFKKSLKKHLHFYFLCGNIIGRCERDTVQNERKVSMDQLLWYHYLIGAVLIISALIIIVTVMLQQSKQQGLSGAIAGGADTFFDKNKGRTVEAKLSKITKIVAAVFFVIGLAAVIMFKLL